MASPDEQAPTETYSLDVGSASGRVVLQSELDGQVLWSIQEVSLNASDFVQLYGSFYNETDDTILVWPHDFGYVQYIDTKDSYTYYAVAMGHSETQEIKLVYQAASALISVVAVTSGLMMTIFA